MMVIAIMMGIMMINVEWLNPIMMKVKMVMMIMMTVAVVNV